MHARQGGLKAEEDAGKFPPLSLALGVVTVSLFRCLALVIPHLRRSCRWLPEHSAAHSDDDPNDPDDDPHVGYPSAQGVHSLTHTWGAQGGC